MFANIILNKYLKKKITSYKTLSRISNIFSDNHIFINSIFSNYNYLNYKSLFILKGLKNDSNRFEILGDLKQKELGNNLIKLKTITQNSLFFLTKDYKETKNNILKGIPKLNCLLESSYSSKSTNFNNESLSLNFESTTFEINSFSTQLNSKNNVNLISINKNDQIIINKDPENLSWFFISNLSTKIGLKKNILYIILKIKLYIANSLKRVYKEQNINVARKTFESIINTMFSRIIVIMPLGNPFLPNEKINLKLYIILIDMQKSIQYVPPIGLPIVDGISKSVYESDRLLSTISFRDSINNLTKKCLYGQKDWLTSIKANLLMGQKLKIGTNLGAKLQKYYITNNYITKLNQH